MPATKLSARLEAQKQLPRLIRMYVSANRTNLTDCAQRSGMSSKTLYNRMNDPGRFTLTELALLRKVLGIPADELIAAVQQKL